MASRWLSSTDAYQLHLESLGRRPTTLRVHLSGLRSWESFCVARHLNPLAADEDATRRWLASQHGLYSRNTVRNRFLAVRAFFRWQGCDPFASFPVPKPEEPPVRPFSYLELRRLLKAAGNLRDRAIVLMLLGSAIRAAELGALQVTDVRWETGTMAVIGKGGKRRLVYPGESALAALRAYVRAEGIRSGYLFRSMGTRAARDRHLSPGTVWSIVKRLARRAGVPSAYPHRFRHTFAHLFLAAGGDVGDLKVILGHSTITMSLRYARYYEAERALDAQRRYNPADALFGAVTSARSYPRGSSAG